MSNVKRLINRARKTQDNEMKNHLYIIAGEYLSIKQDYELADDELASLSRKLISIYDYQALRGETIWHPQAMTVVVKLGRLNEIVFNCIKENDDNYARLMSYEDSDPYSPNSLEVLTMIGTRQANDLLNIYRDSNSLISHQFEN